MRSIISWMARSPVAANLLMIFLVALGILSFTRLGQEVFPEASLEAVLVRVLYPGAAPGEVESGVLLRIEEQLDGVDQVSRVRSFATSGLGQVIVELELGADVQQAVDRVKQAIDRVAAFPDEAEKPVVVALTNRRRVMQLAIYGETEGRTLKELAYRARDELTSFSGVSFVRVEGVRRDEIAIEVGEATLREYGLSLADVADTVRKASLELGGGSIESRHETILVRTIGQRRQAEEFRQIKLKAGKDGAALRLGDIASVTDGFVEVGAAARLDDSPAALVSVYRGPNERILDIVRHVEEYLDKFRHTLPEGVEVAIWGNEARLLKGRLSLLTRSGLMGLVLVLLFLSLAMGVRLAFWTAVGLLVAFVSVFSVLGPLEVTINQLSLFGFVIALGVVVDDAIVIAERVHHEQRSLRDPTEGAIAGTVSVASPVIFGVLTTVVAFSPLLFVPGVSGAFLRNIPLVVIAALLFSLVEALLILPSHLSHPKKPKIASGSSSLFARLQAQIELGRRRFVEGPFSRIIGFITRNSGLTIVCAVSVMLVTTGLVIAGFVRFSFFPVIEGEFIGASLEMPEGTSLEETERLARLIERRGRETARALQTELPAEHPPLIERSFVLSGVRSNDSPNASEADEVPAENVAQITLRLSSAETREVSAVTFEQLWRQRVGLLPNAKSVSFQSEVFSVGQPIHVELFASSAQVLQQAVEELRAEIESFAGVHDIRDDYQTGHREIHLSLRPGARSLGLTVDALARQIRGSLYGLEALRLQRNREEVLVMVRLPAGERDDLADLDNIRIRTSQGAEVPLSEVATLSLDRSPAEIYRRDQKRVATVTGDVDETVVAAQRVVEELRRRVLPQLTQKHQGLGFSFEGEQRWQAESLERLSQGFTLALLGIYCLLAIPLRSYVQPLIVMAVIPFGFIGAVFGHILLGLNLSLMSLFGLVGLSGVVVNDSLLLVDFVNKNLSEGQELEGAILNASSSRFRPIVLTSLTTFLGVLPLILEPSLQARFLVPMAVSLAFGVLFATGVVLVLIPALLVAQASAGQATRQALAWVGSTMGAGEPGLLDLPDLSEHRTPGDAWAPDEEQE